MIGWIILAVVISILISFGVAVRTAKKHGDIGKGKIYGWFTFLGCIVIIWVSALLLR